jgi:hypothetical protein
MAAEVALEILSGAERADALGHMEHCVSCRVLVEGLAQTGDSLLLLAPEAEPPMGFESRVAAHVAQDAQRHQAPPAFGEPVAEPAGEHGQVVELGGRAGPTPIRPKQPSQRARTIRRRRTALAAAAAAAIIVGGTAAGVTVIEHNGSSGHSEVADQSSLRSGQFMAATGQQVGQVYTYSGNPSWVFMNVDASGANGTYTCELKLANGATVPLGQFDVHDGIGEWAHTVAVDVKQITTARLVSPSGATLATAKLS